MKKKTQVKTKPSILFPFGVAIEFPSQEKNIKDNASSSWHTFRDEKNAHAYAANMVRAYPDAKVVIYKAIEVVVPQPIKLKTTTIQYT